ncbi:MAG: DUF5317 domain-containing protein [Firmicutes bacterium]|nr:DUF5317 domain-containing protein [Bacillota bacterium]
MVFVVLLAAVALVVILFFGGKLDNLLSCRFKHPWLVLVAVVLKIISISGLHDLLGLPEAVIPFLRVLSLLMAVFFVLLNFSWRGFPLVGLGLLSNTLVILLNGGNMPVKEVYTHLAFTGPELDKLKDGLPVDSFILVSSDTKLSFLGDVLLMPQWVPLTKLFSIGDVIVTLGGIIFITYYLRKGAGAHFNN